MRGIVAILAILLAAASPAVAQQYTPANSHERAAAELIDLLKVEEATLAAFDMMTESMLGQNPLLAQFRDIFDDFFKEYTNWDQLLPEYVRIYSRTYTESELRELIAFYKSPVGRKSIEVMPQLMRESAALGQRQIEPHLPVLEQRIQARMMGGG